MGAWGSGILDDDTALDALEELKASSEIIADMEKYLDAAIEADYVEYEDAQYALASAAIVDGVINGTPYWCGDEDLLDWTHSKQCSDFLPLKSKAVKAIDAVLSDGSELRELWEENDALYDAWKADKLSVKKRLGQ